MAEVQRFSSTTIKSWLEGQTSSIFVPVHSRAKKLLGEMRKALDNLTESSKMLQENSAKEIEKRNMKTYGRARALNKLSRLFLDRLKPIKVPEKPSYDSSRAFAQTVQQALAITEVDIRNWFPRVSPFFILDRRRFQAVFDRTTDSLRVLNDFIAKEYVKTKTLEDTFQLIDKLQTLEQQLTTLKERKKKTDSEKAHVEGEIAETQQRMADLKNKGDMNQLTQVNAEIEELSVEVKRDLHHLQKPFIKVQALSQHGGGSGLTPEELGKINQYLANPFEAFATEEEGYPLLKQILPKLDRLIAEGKLNLKPEKTRKAQQTIDSLLNRDSLAGLNQKCIDALRRRSQLSSSTEVEEARQSLAKLEQHLEGLERKKMSVESEEQTIENACNETSERIRNHKSQIEKNIFSFTGKRVLVE